MTLEFRNNIISLFNSKKALQLPELTELIVRETSKLSLSSTLEQQSRLI